MGCEMNCAIGNRVGKPIYVSRLAFVESQYLVISIHEWSKTQLYASSVPETSKQNVGFHSVSDGCRTRTVWSEIS